MPDLIIEKDYIYSTESEGRLITDSFRSFFSAVLNNKLQVLVDLKSTISQAELTEAFTALDYYAFGLAAEKGYLPILHFLTSLMTPEQIAKALTARDYYAHYSAASEGHLEVLFYLEGLMSPEQLSNALKYDDFRVYRDAVESGLRLIERHLLGHIIVFEYVEMYLEDKEPLDHFVKTLIDQWRALAQIRPYEYFTPEARECKLGFHLVRYLIRKNSAESCEMLRFIHTIPAINSRVTEELLSLAVGYYNREEARCLLPLLEDKKLLMLPQDVLQRAYSLVCESKILHVIETLPHLIRRHPGAIPGLPLAIQRLRGLLSISTIETDYVLCHSAIEEENIIFLWHFMLYMPLTHRYELLGVSNYSLYRKAVKKGHVEIMSFLQSLMTPIQLIESLSAVSYEAQQNFALVSEQHLNILVRPEHLNEFNSLLNTLIEKWPDLAQGKWGRILGYQIACFLIKQNSAVACQKLNFMLEVPPFASMLEIYHVNSLLDNALFANNQYVIMQLFSHPKILKKICIHSMMPKLEIHNMFKGMRALIAAAVDNFYLYRLATKGNYSFIHHLKGFYSVRFSYKFTVRKSGIVSPSESISTPLSPSEYLIMEHLIRHYGSPAINVELFNFLKRRYIEDPATIIVKGKCLNLPFSWWDFYQLALSKDERKSAKIAYYKHKVHTASRLLGFNNVWKNNKYLQPYDYLPLYKIYLERICFFWKAASDREMPATDGHSIESRIDHFIAQLALINRAQNWANLRKNSMGKLERYDDLQVDRPPCFPGILNALNQSLVGHPLFKPFNMEILESELRDFARAQFVKKVDGTNKALLLQVKRSFKEGRALNEEQRSAMKSLDIPKADCDVFIATMRSKYAGLWTPSCTRFLKQKLRLLDSHATHVNQLWILVDFNNLLRNIAQEDTRADCQTTKSTLISSSQLSQLGLFASSSVAASSVPVVPDEFVPTCD